MIEQHQLIEFFNRKVNEYNQPQFIAADPICVPHQFSQLQDIEIAGLFAALFAWGNRTSIINNARKLMQLMGQQPYAFITQLAGPEDPQLKPLFSFVHRTFNGTDLMHLIRFLHHHYVIAQQPSLETAFSDGLTANDDSIEPALNHFYHYVFNAQLFPDYPTRTRKHIASPAKKSSCKRLCMYLRWMVRRDNKGVDFGLWQRIQPRQLVCPIDVHVARVAKRFQLLQRPQTDWLAALELTHYLRKLDANDPAKYDFALFGLGVIEKY